MVVVCNKPLHMLATLTNYLRPSRYSIALDSTKLCATFSRSEVPFQHRTTIIDNSETTRSREILLYLLTISKNLQE